MSRKYEQYCGIARALDVVGDRWTLLIVRNLLVGPKRFTDLRQQLPGIGSAMLTSRLKRLESLGVIERETLPPPAASQVYELTGLGRQLEPTLMALGRWGLHWMGELGEDEALEPEWTLFTIKTLYRPERAAGVHDVFELHVDGEAMYAAVDDGELTTGLGPAPSPPTLTLRGDRRAFASLVVGHTRLRDAIDSGDIAVEGPRDALRRLAALFESPRANARTAA